LFEFEALVVEGTEVGTNSTGTHSIRWPNVSCHKGGKKPSGRRSSSQGACCPLQGKKSLYRTSGRKTRWELNYKAQLVEIKLILTAKKRNVGGGPGKSRVTLAPERRGRLIAGAQGGEDGKKKWENLVEGG